MFYSLTDRDPRGTCPDSTKLIEINTLFGWSLGYICTKFLVLLMSNFCYNAVFYSLTDRDPRGTYPNSTKLIEINNLFGLPNFVKCIKDIYIHTYIYTSIHTVCPTSRPILYSDLLYKMRSSVNDLIFSLNFWDKL